MESNNKRRVGTITMGITLIIIGVLILFSLLNKTLDITMVVKFAPVILISLGIEILVQYFFVKRDKIKYDILSIFLYGILIFGSLGFAVAAPFLEYLSPERQRKELEIRKEFDEDVATRLEQLSFVDTAYTSMSLNYAFPDDITWNTASKYCEYSSISVHLQSFPESKEEFAAMADQIRKALVDLPINNTRIEITSASKAMVKEGEVYQYSITLHGNYSKNKTIDQMVNSVEQFVLDHNYDGEEEYEF